MALCRGGERRGEDHLYVHPPLPCTTQTRVLGTPPTPRTPCINYPYSSGQPYPLPFTSAPFPAAAEPPETTSRVPPTGFDVRYGRSVRHRLERMAEGVWWSRYCQQNNRRVPPRTLTPPTPESATTSSDEERVTGWPPVDLVEQVVESLLDAEDFGTCSAERREMRRLRRLSRRVWAAADATGVPLIHCRPPVDECPLPSSPPPLATPRRRRHRDRWHSDNLPVDQPPPTTTTTIPAYAETTEYYRRHPPPNYYHRCPTPPLTRPAPNNNNNSSRL